MAVGTRLHLHGVWMRNRATVLSGVSRVRAATPTSRSSGPRYFFGDACRARAAEWAATADRINSSKKASSNLSPSRGPMTQRAFRSRLELNSARGSSSEAPRKNVRFTNCLYDSPVQTSPPCNHTGVPEEDGLSHFHSSWISGSRSGSARGPRRAQYRVFRRYGVSSPDRAVAETGGGF